MGLKTIGSETICLNRPPDTVTAVSTFTAKGAVRPNIQGKFIFLDRQKLYLRGVTYGTFRPDSNGDEFPTPARVRQDFAQMAEAHINVVRVYTRPPRWLLDEAYRHGLRILIGLPVERSVAFVDYKQCAKSIETMVRNEVRACGGHRALLGYSIGNEIPASIVRWQGARRMETFLERLYNAVKEEDPGSLVTYVNYPSTEYLRLPFLDFISFNVYLESQKRLEEYLARLHNLAGDRPLVMGELGLDSLRHGERNQARVLDWQVRTAFAGGCAGAFVYAWTDEWFRGGAEVDDWKFGITDRCRRPKPALAAVRDAFADVPLARNCSWPRISVIVCTYNGARTLAECLYGLHKLNYPNFEVIVVNDGSTDNSAAIATEFGVRVISTDNRGLSSARNTGCEAATGEIVAYIDDDAYPDPDWLTYLAASFSRARSPMPAAVGGPNIPPPTDGPSAQCVARAPGGPSHVLLSDVVAEHIPGCNMAFRKSCLQAIGGFDPQFRVAGDDVDVCWRLQKQGWTIGFSPAAVVWHHRRNSVRTYLRQQCGYGKAEALLERKWPEKYNAAGHLTWSGRVYNNGVSYLGWRATRIYHGTWGMAPFQSLYERAPNWIQALPMMPEWFLIILALGVLEILALFWKPLHWTAPFLILAVAAPLINCAYIAAKVRFHPPPASRLGGLKLRLLVAALHWLQPLARLRGRIRHGLTIWRRRVITGYAFPRPWTADIWSRRSLGSEERLGFLEKVLRSIAPGLQRGGEFDCWDLRVVSGAFGSAWLTMAVEYHGDGRQLVRIRSGNRCSAVVLILTSLLASLSIYSWMEEALIVSTILGTITAVLGIRIFHECAAATSALLTAVRRMEAEEKSHHVPSK